LFHLPSIKTAGFRSSTGYQRCRTPFIAEQGPEKTPTQGAFTGSEAQLKMQGSEQKNRVKYLERDPRRLRLSQRWSEHRTKVMKVNYLKLLQNRLGEVR